MTVYLLYLSFEDGARDVRPFDDLDRAREFARSTFRRGAPVLKCAKVEHWVPTASGLAMAKVEEIPDGRGRWENYSDANVEEYRFFYDGGSIRIIQDKRFADDWTAISEVGGFGMRWIGKGGLPLSKVKCDAIELVRSYLSKSLTQLEAAIV